MISSFVICYKDTLAEGLFQLEYSFLPNAFLHCLAKEQNIYLPNFSQIINKKSFEQYLH